MGFTAEQCRALTAKLDGRAVRERTQGGQTLHYIEGWYAMAEANRVFGFEGWDRETVSLRCVWDGLRHGRSACAYIAQVRIRVRAGEILVCRDGHGTGIGSGATPGEAHETAVKEAETDATKRALVTFGNLFGLCLYDKERKQVRRARRKPLPPIEWQLRSPAGDVTQSFTDPAQFCSALRRALEISATPADLTALWSQHGSALAALEQLPQLTSERGAHYSEILAGLYRKRLQELQQTTMASVPAALRPRRVRDKAHLRRVAQQPCLICGRLPAQAHHLKFLEPRGLGLKPSDAFAVPLCRLHHRALHDEGNEEAWWQQHKIDPVGEAERLWLGAGAPAEAPDAPQAPTKPALAVRIKDSDPSSDHTAR
jgi:DNA recombination protein Rad52